MTFVFEKEATNFCRSRAFGLEVHYVHERIKVFLLLFLSEKEEGSPL